jgi:hypothetical protein
VEALNQNLLNLARDFYHRVDLESLFSRADPTAIDSFTAVQEMEFPF